MTGTASLGSSIGDNMLDHVFSHNLHLEVSNAGTRLKCKLCCVKYVAAFQKAGLERERVPQFHFFLCVVPATSAALR